MSRVIVAATYPDKSAEIKVSKEITLAEVQKLAETALKLNLKEYQWSYVNFGEDVVLLKDKADDHKPTIKDNTTFVAIAPASLLPSRIPKQEETVESGDDRYKGLTPENIFVKLSKLQGKQRQIAFEYLDTYSVDIFKSVSFGKLPKANVAAILGRDTLSLPEIQVFEALIRWGDEELKRKGEKPSVEGRKGVIGELVNLVRFPLLSTEEVAAKVTTHGLLSAQQTLELFTYLAQKDFGTASPGSSLSVFSSKPRKGSSRYGVPGSKFTDGFALTALEGNWSWGSGDHVNTSDRVTNSDLDNIGAFLTGQRQTTWKSGDEDWNFPRGSERCGIYTYPTSDPHAFNLKFSKGLAVLRSFRFFCTRLERGVTLRIYARKTGQSGWGDNLFGGSLPFLATGGNQKQWVDIKFDKPVHAEEFRMEVRGGQCAVHSLNFINGP